MMCPNCAAENPEDSGQCVQCGYKFRFGFGYNDPKKVTFMNISKSVTKRSKVKGFLFILISIFIFIVVILSWLRAL